MGLPLNVLKIMETEKYEVRLKALDLENGMNIYGVWNNDMCAFQYVDKWQSANAPSEIEARIVECILNYGKNEQKETD